MKQVFPDIRPRRLGTRGHSRYCYAAMRKATKLQPPNLPDLSSPNESWTKSTDNEESTWKVIKSWSEGLLNAQFESADDLATHISHNKLSLSSASTSKQLLQKKIMQREIKDRRRNNVNMRMCDCFMYLYILFFVSESNHEEASQEASKVVSIS